MSSIDPIKVERLRLLERKLALKTELPHLYGQKFYKWMREFWDSRNRVLLLTAANQIGKDVCDFTDIPTPKGFVKMGDLKVGDVVFAQDGSPTKVVAVPYKGSGPGYRITFTDGSSIVAGPQHLWVCKTSKERFRKNYKSRGRAWDNPTLGQWKTLTTEEIVTSGGYAPYASSNYTKVSIPICSPMDVSKKELFDPYLLGLLLGDGCLRGSIITVTSIDPEIIEYLKSFGGRRVSSTIAYRLPLEIREETKRLGIWNKLSNAKFIPDQYFTASIEQRLALLRGLMDTDGTAGKSSKCITFTTVSPQLCKDVRTLVGSLGGTVKTTKKKSGYKNKEGQYIKCQDSYNLRIKLKLNPFNLPRKACLHFPDIKYKHERIIESIAPLAQIQSSCITVDHPSGTFLATRDFIVTHNSSIQIRKIIEVATNKSLWPELWPGKTPNLGWYLYPSKEVATQEFETKWQEWLPKNKEDPVYGWQERYQQKRIDSILFNSGFLLSFKTYAYDVANLQTGSVYYLACDEELPVELYAELIFRISATNGYFSMVFTATQGQELWYRAMEKKGETDEAFPDAHKLQVSLFDCQTYEDGSNSFWTDDRIKQVIARCGTENEVLRRVYGRFVVDLGRKYSAFSTSEHMCAPHPVSPEWRIYAGIDSGSGGEKGDPAAITFTAVSPNRQLGYVIKSWRGDKILTTATDIVLKYIEMSKGLNVSEIRYDYAAKDVQTVAMRMGISMLPAEKNQERGESIVNSLYKNRMLYIFSEGENIKLSQELSTLQNSKARNNKAKDNLADAHRYCVTTIPWDFSVVGTRDKPAKPKELTADEETDLARRGQVSQVRGFDAPSEFEEWNSLYGS